MEWLSTFPTELAPYLYLVTLTAGVMLLWDTVEVGRNDAANLVNAVFGARVLPRRSAVLLAGIGVILGAALSSAVMDTARKGIFSPTALAHAGDGAIDGLILVLSVYIAVYIVDTVLLYSYSAFGMPVSTTACLVFELLGASFALHLVATSGQGEVVRWGKAGTVVFAIVCSIAVSGLAAYTVQRLLRNVIGHHDRDATVLRRHGGWIGGGMMAGLVYFMLVKGMKHVGVVAQAHDAYRDWAAGLNLPGWAATALLIATIWLLIAITIHTLFAMRRETATRMLFPALTVFGMFCMAVAFGQNDVANCAAPGLGALNLLARHQDGVPEASEAAIPFWALAGCGLLMAAGMLTRNAERVTRSEVRTGSMSDSVRLYAPRWCRHLAQILLRLRGSRPETTPPAATHDPTKRIDCSGCHRELDPHDAHHLCPDCGKPIADSLEDSRPDYDTLRAAVILSVSASVIAFASSLALPVSTTYVAFAAVVASGIADRVFTRGDADLKLARALWVVFSWFAAAVIAAVATGAVALLLYFGGTSGILAGVALNLTVRTVLQRRADALEHAATRQAADRRTAATPTVPAIG